MRRQKVDCVGSRDIYKPVFWLCELSVTSLGRVSAAPINGFIQEIRLDSLVCLLSSYVALGHSFQGWLFSVLLGLPQPLN